jgi:ferric-dicitrate binding protein FerR (iron transport regulator)
MALTSAAVLMNGNLRAQTPEPKDIGGAARLLSFTGQISVMRDSSAWALRAGDLVQPQQVVVTGPDGWGIFEVSDGSKFEVFPNSKVVFRATRSAWRDLLEVWLGKVRVQIEHFGTVPNSNRIHTPSAVIAVRGTIFDVTVDDVTDTTLVQDEEGSVSVRHLLRPGQEKILTAGESVLIYKNQPLAKAAIDKGGLMQKALRVASDVFYQVAVNGQRAASTVAKGPGSSTGIPADKDNAPPPPTGAPPPPAGPPPPPL